jgi:uncharacterized protein
MTSIGNNVKSADNDSPCNGVCQLDIADVLCIGCLRTVDEIMLWPNASPPQKAAILAALEQRRDGRPK